MANAAYFYDPLESHSSRAISYSRVGHNTGNVAFMEAITSIIECDKLTRQDIFSEEGLLDKYEAFITSDIIWMSENTEPSESVVHLLDNFPDKKVVPISVGLQCDSYNSEFKLSKSLVKTLQRIQDRATIAVRGFFTAEILMKYGIKNINVIGCPSVYQIPLHQRSLDRILSSKKVTNSTSNFHTFPNNLSQHDVDFLNYVEAHKMGFVEQTEFDISRYRGGNQIKESVVRYIMSEGREFFSIQEWTKYLEGFDFSMGARFHGNVVALISGLRSLFVTTDSRTNEMAQLFSFPFIDIKDFDGGRDVQEYFDMADYSVFCAKFHSMVGGLICYLNGNGLKITDQYKNSVDGFDFGSAYIGRPWSGVPLAS